MRKKLLMTLLTVTLLASCALLPLGTVGAAETGSAQNPIVKMVWTAAADGPDGGSTAVYNLMSGNWALENNFILAGGDKLKYEIYVPQSQFATLLDKNGNAMTVDDFSFGNLDLISTMVDANGEKHWPTMFYSTGAEYLDENGNAYTRMSSADGGKATGGFYERSIALDLLAGGNMIFQSYVHLHTKKGMKSGSSFTYYMQNIRIECADGNIKYMFDGNTVNKNGVFKGATDQGSNGYGLYSTDNGEVWSNKDIDLTVTTTENATFKVGRIADGLKNEYLYEHGETAYELDLSGIKAYSKDGSELSFESTLINLEGEGEPINIPSNQIVVLEKGSYGLTVTATDTNDSNNILIKKVSFTVDANTKPVIGDMPVISPVAAGEKQFLPLVTAKNPLDTTTDITCDITVTNKVIGSSYDVFTDTTKGAYFIADAAGVYVITYTAENATAKVTKAVSIEITAAENSSHRVSVTVPENLRAADQRKFFAANILSIEYSNAPFAPEYKLVYDVYSPSEIAGIGYLGVMTNRGTQAGGYDWADTDYNRGEMQSLSDQNGKSMAVTTDLTSEFSSGWYHREVVFPNVDKAITAEATVMNITMLIDSKAKCGANLDVFFKNIQIRKVDDDSLVADFSKNGIRLLSKLPFDETVYPSNVDARMRQSIDPVAEATFPQADIKRGDTVDAKNIVTQLDSALSSDFVLNNMSVKFGEKTIQVQDGKFKTDVAGDYKISFTLTYAINDISVTMNKTLTVTVAKYQVLPTLVVMDEYPEQVGLNDVITVHAATASNPLGETLTLKIDLLKGATVIKENISVGETFTIDSFALYTVRYTATDQDGNSTVIDCKMGAQDTEAPEIIVENVPSTGEINSDITLPAATVTDNSTEQIDAVISVQHSDGTVFNVTNCQFKPTKLGAYQVVYTATDSRGNSTSTREYTIIVSDTTHPVIEVKGIPTTGNTGIEMLFPIAKVTDNSNENLSADIVVDGDSTKYSMNGNVLVFFGNGTYKVKYCAEDSSGNIAETTWYEVVITDSTQPQITVIGMPASVLLGVDVTLPTATITDNSGESLTATVTVTDPKGTTFAPNGAFAANVVGAYTVEYTAVDSGGNRATLSFVMHVTDSTKPVITVDDLPSGVLRGQTLALPSATVTDNSGEELTAVITVIYPDGYAALITDGQFTPLYTGEYTIVYSACDSSFNNGEKRFTIVVTEPIAAGCASVSGGGNSGIFTLILTLATVILTLSIIVLARKKRKFKE